MAVIKNKTSERNREFWSPTMTREEMLGVLRSLPPVIIDGTRSLLDAIADQHPNSEVARMGWGKKGGK